MDFELHKTRPKCRRFDVVTSFRLDITHALLYLHSLRFRLIPIQWGYNPEINMLYPLVN
jgi:hypothetical protein